MRLGKNTSHDEWGDNFVRNRTPSVMQPFVEKDPLVFFDRLCRGKPPRQSPFFYFSTRNCWVVTRGWQINALPSRLLSSMGTAVIWLLS